jgi:hypothetical protein
VNWSMSWTVPLGQKLRHQPGAAQNFLKAGEMTGALNSAESKR